MTTTSGLVRFDALAAGASRAEILTALMDGRAGLYARAGFTRHFGPVI